MGVIRKGLDIIGGIPALLGMLVLGLSTLVFLFNLWTGAPIAETVEANYGGAVFFCLALLFIQEDEDEALSEKAYTAGLLMAVYAVVGAVVLLVTVPFHGSLGAVADLAVPAIGVAIIFGLFGLAVRITVAFLRLLFGAGRRTVGSIGGRARAVLGFCQRAFGRLSTTLRGGERELTTTGRARSEGSEGRSQASSASTGTSTASAEAGVTTADDSAADTRVTPDQLADGTPTDAHRSAVAAVDALGLTDVKGGTEAGPVVTFRAWYPDRGQPVTIFTPDPTIELQDVADRLTRRLTTWRQVATHPNTVELFEYDTDPRPWGVAAVPSGEAFSDSRQSLSAAERVDVLLGVADALQAVHRYNEQHLFLRPGSIAVDGGTEPTGRILKWGVKDVVDMAAGEYTQSSFTAPEQIDGDEFGPPGAHTDVYRLGAVGYWAFTGDPPVFDIDDSLAASITDGALLAPTTRDPSLPERADDVLLTALATDPGDRYDSVYTFRQHLTSVRDDL